MELKTPIRQHLHLTALSGGPARVTCPLLVTVSAVIIGSGSHENRLPQILYGLYRT